MARIGLLHSSSRLNTESLSASDSITNAGNQSQASRKSTLNLSNSNTYLGVVKTVNENASAINLSENTLNQLDSLVNGLMDLTQMASDPELSEDERTKINEKFANLAVEYQEVVAAATPEELSYLASGGLEDVLNEAGLDSESSASIASLLNEVITEPALEDAKGESEKENRQDEQKETFKLEDYLSSNNTDSTMSSLKDLKEVLTNGSNELTKDKLLVKEQVELLRSLKAQDETLPKDTEPDVLVHKVAQQIRSNPEQALATNHSLDAKTVNFLTTQPAGS